MKPQLIAVVFLTLAVWVSAVGFGQGFSTGSTATSAFGTGTRTLGQGVNAPNATGATGSPGSQVEQMNASAGQVTGSERFIQENRQPGAFVGADTGEVQNARSQATNQGGRAGQGQNGLTQLNNIFSQFGQLGAGRAGRATQTTRRTLRAPIRLGFVPPRVSSTMVSRRLNDQVARIPRFAASQGVSIRVEGRTAILQGVVDSQQQSELMARIARLEPGISDVRNELQVAASPTPAP